jgi:hypothetical protein
LTRPRIFNKQIPVRLDAPILSVRCSSDEAPTWVYAGQLAREISVATQGSSLAKVREKSNPLTLNATSLLDYSALPAISAYSLLLIPGRYLKDLRIEIWEYTGPLDDPAIVSLTRLEAKVDAL